MRSPHLINTFLNRLYLRVNHPMTVHQIQNAQALFFVLFLLQLCHPPCPFLLFILVWEGGGSRYEQGGPDISFHSFLLKQLQHYIKTKVKILGLTYLRNAYQCLPTSFYARAGAEPEGWAALPTQVPPSNDWQVGWDLGFCPLMLLHYVHFLLCEFKNSWIITFCIIRISIGG